LAEHLAAMIVAKMREETVANTAKPDGRPRPSGTKFRVVKGYQGPELTLLFNSHKRRTTGDRASLPAGTVLTLDSEAAIGNVWFRTPLGRARADHGSVEDMLRAGVIEEAE